MYRKETSNRYWIIYMWLNPVAKFAGYTLKEAVKEHLLANGYRVEDMGAVNYNLKDDYPDLIFPVNQFWPLQPF